MPIEFPNLKEKQFYPILKNTRVLIVLMKKEICVIQTAIVQFKIIFVLIAMLTIQPVIELKNPFVKIMVDIDWGHINMNNTNNYVFVKAVNV